jgi:ABC-type multidrug transport system ATPase subunit
VSFPGSIEAPLPRIGFVDQVVNFILIITTGTLLLSVQSDVLPGNLSVRESLIFAARLRMPEYISETDKIARVDYIIDQLDLLPIADLRIGALQRRVISGGEIRRLSIGLELVASPDVIVLDEPTSGACLTEVPLTRYQ